MNLLNGKYVFQKRKRILWNTLWTAGSKSKELRGSLAIIPRERVPATAGHPIQYGRTRLDEGRWPAGEEATGGGAIAGKPRTSPANSYRALQATIFNDSGAKRQRRRRGSHQARRCGRGGTEVNGQLATADLQVRQAGESGARRRTTKEKNWRLH